MDYTTVTDLAKPVGTEPFSRSILNDNSDKIDKHAIALALMKNYYGTLSKGALVKDENGRPQSQSFTGPNGLAGSKAWSFAANSVTITFSVTAPVAFSITKTVDLTDLSSEVTIT